MLSSRSRILANLNAKENPSCSRKRSSEESNMEHVSKRRTVTSFELPQVKSSSLFSNKSIKRQTSIKSYCQEEQKENKPVKEQKKFKIFNESKEDEKKPKQEDDPVSMMCAEEAPEKYWELLAEERRKGLEMALKENEELAEEIREKDEVIKELRVEVGELKETAQHAKYLASVLEELGNDCNISLEPLSEEEEESEGSDLGSDKKDISASYPEEEPSSSGFPDVSEENSEGEDHMPSDCDSQPLFLEEDLTSKYLDDVSKDISDCSNERCSSEDSKANSIFSKSESGSEGPDEENDV